ncbi:hypothetical protein KKG83_07665 [Candidatus Micrarchaeota archaeon]|nr:hypothetical protein [Candidatus Micrarchaeota archaeon]MBU2477318.1 hypothetical protein [Candidatus Micrarchaeota archaeon]
MKEIVFGLVVLALMFSGCPQPEQVYFKDIQSAPITSECTEFKEDICGLYACMTDRCWCEQSPDQILLQGNTVIDSEQKAVFHVNNYLNTIASKFSATKAVTSNNVFFGVFAEDSEGNEKAFTVGADGTIIKTQCGV